MQSFNIISDDGVEVRAYSWTVAKPVAVLQIVHGMQEHAGRYAHFAAWMNVHQVAVYADDHIGHGMSAKTVDELSHFPRTDDWHRSVDILHKLTERIHEDYPGVPLFILGHSMGSVLVQTYMIRYGKEATGYLLSGAIRQPGFMAVFGIALARLLSVFFGPGDRSKLIISLGYGQYNRHFRPNRTGADWLCSNNNVVDDYINSPLCGIPLTNRFYENLFQGFRYVALNGNLRQIPPGKPVYIFAGSLDPAGRFGKTPGILSRLFTKYSGAKVKLKLYPKGRHEILNEKNREEVYGDVLEWMGGNLSQQSAVGSQQSAV